MQKWVKRNKSQTVLYYVKINPYTKFQVNITKEGREKVGKLNFAKGNNSNKSKSNASKVELDPY